MTKRLYSVALFITIALAIVGCSYNQNIKDSVNGYLEAIKEFRISEIEDYMSIKQEDIISEYISQNLQDDIPNPSKALDLLRTITSKIEYNIVSINTKGEKSTVVINIKTVDSKHILKESYPGISKYVSIKEGKNISEGKTYLQLNKTAFDRMTDIIMNNINDPKTPYIENKVKLHLTYNKKNGRWIVNKDKKMVDDLQNAILGDFPDVLKKLKSEKM